MAAVISGVTREPGSRGRKGAPKRASEAVDESIIPKTKAPRKRQEKNAHLAPALPADVLPPHQRGPPQESRTTKAPATEKQREEGRLISEGHKLYAALTDLEAAVRVKRVRTASTKYDGSFAVAMPTKGSRAKDDEYYVNGFDEPMVGRYFRTDEPLYPRSNKGRKQPEESPSSSTGGDADELGLKISRSSNTRGEVGLSSASLTEVDGEVVTDEGTPEMWSEITDYVDDVAKSGTLSQTEMTRLRRLARQRSEPLRRVYGLWKHSHSRFVNNVMGLLNDAAADD